MGSDQRKAFDILGDPVNLACRLMQLCSQTDSTFLCDELTTTICSGKFMFAKLPKPFKMKGQSQKLSVYTVERSQEYENLGLDGLRRRIQVHTTTICGRYQERALLDSSVRRMLLWREAAERGPAGAIAQ
eukprot:RCo015791